MAKAVKISKKEIPVSEITNNVQLIRAFNNYSQLWDKAEMIKWLVDYLTDTNPDMAHLITSGRYYYHSPMTGITSILTICKMARLVHLGVDIPECNKARLDNVLESIVPMDKPKEEKQVVDYGPIVNYMHWELDDAEDAAARGERAYVIMGPDVPQAHVDEVVSRAKKSLESLEESFVVSFDGEKERPWRPDVWNLLKALYSGIIAQVQKKDGKPRPKPQVKQRKPKALKPSQLAKMADAFIHMKSFNDLNLTSIHPLKIIDSDEVWLYNTQHRRLIFLKGEKLSIKGMSVTGVDPKESYAVTLRLKDKVLGPDINRDYVLTMVQDFLAQGRKRQDASNRAGPQVVILAAFKNGNAK